MNELRRFEACFYPSKVAYPSNLRNIQRIRSSPSMYVYVCVRVCMYVVCLYVCMYVHMWVVCMCACLYVYVNLTIHTKYVHYIWTYVHVHTHTHFNNRLIKGTTHLLASAAWHSAISAECSEPWLISCLANALTLVSCMCCAIMSCGWRILYCCVLDDVHIIFYPSELANQKDPLWFAHALNIPTRY